jgi:hypothetical protein
MTASSNPARRRAYFGTTAGSNVPDRSLGIWTVTSPIWVRSVFGVDPFLEFIPFRPTGSCLS